MSESEEARTPPPEQNSPPPQRTEAAPQQPDPDVAYSVWPPTRPTREAIVSRLVKNLSSPSALSPHYHAMPLDEATPVARAIEQAAFDSAGAAASADDDGADVLQAYATSIGRRMLDSVQRRTRPASLVIDGERP